MKKKQKPSALLGCIVTGHVITLCSEEGEDIMSQTQLTMTDKQFKRKIRMAAAAHRLTQEGMGAPGGGGGAEGASWLLGWPGGCSR